MDRVGEEGKKQHAIQREGCFSAQVINSLLRSEEKAGYETENKKEKKMERKVGKRVRTKGEREANALKHFIISALSFPFDDDHYI